MAPHEGISIRMSQSTGFLKRSLNNNMSSLFQIGQILKGKVGQYIITKEVQETVWFAR